METVRQTMGWADRNLAEARVHVDGKDVAVRTGNLVYALFPHDTSRATDPQSHLHAVIANLSRLPEQFRNPDRVDEKTGEVIRDDARSEEQRVRKAWALSSRSWWSRYH